MRAVILSFINLLFNCSVYGQTEEKTFSNKCYWEKYVKIATDRFLYYRCDSCNSIYQVFQATPSHLPDGFYEEYYDVNFSKLRIKGNYYKSRNTGLWQEFYENGVLKSEGAYWAVSYRYTKSSIYAIDILKISDTIKMKYSAENCDSLRQLVVFIDSFRQISSKQKIRKKIPFDCPAELSLKTGEWKYYGEDGTLIRREFYIRGRLYKTD